MEFVKLFGLSGLLHPNVPTDFTLMISLTGEYYQEIQQARWSLTKHYVHDNL
jgi:hypothetical protein